MQNVIDFEMYRNFELPNDLTTIEDFSKKYKLSKSYIYKLCAKGVLRRFKFGKFKISEKEALRIMAQGGIYGWHKQEKN